MSEPPPAPSRPPNSAPLDPDAQAELADRLDSYDYQLPPERIAATPADQRTRSRLLVHDRHTRTTEHCRFAEVGGWLRDGDLLVVNDTRVVPARLAARRRTGGAVEVLLHPTMPPAAAPDDARFHCLALLRPSAKLHRGEELEVGGDLDLRIEDEPAGELRHVSSGATLQQLLELGRIPLPPYLPGERDDSLDQERYQTVYADRPGAIAAPTAGLHFTAALLEDLKSSGVDCARLTLHVGPGTFLPVRTERLSQHEMHPEAYDIPERTAEAINNARAGGGRVIAVGTTTTRALESAISVDGRLEPGTGVASLMIRPPHVFRAIDGLITNFHLPRSTLLALVSAFAGRETILDLYRSAAAGDYRFYSYGDAMLLL